MQNLLPSEEENALYLETLEKEDIALIPLNKKWLKKFIAEEVDIGDITFHLPRETEKNIASEGMLIHRVVSREGIISFGNIIKQELQKAARPYMFSRDLEFNSIYVYKLTSSISLHTIMKEPKSCFNIGVHLLIKGTGKLCQYRVDGTKRGIPVKHNSLILTRNKGFCNKDVRTQYSIEIEKGILLYVLSFRQKEVKSKKNF